MSLHFTMPSLAACSGVRVRAAILSLLERVEALEKLVRKPVDEWVFVSVRGRHGSSDASH